MRNVKVGRTVAAAPSSVWVVLADYPNIAQWNTGVLRSRAVGELTVGVGAQRQCDLAPKGTMRMRETVTAWQSEERMVVEIDQIEKMPVRSASMAFELAPDGDRTRVDMTYTYVPKLLGVIMGPMMDRQMSRGFRGFIDLLEAEAQVRAGG